MGLTEVAEQRLKEVMGHSGKLKEDTYLIPYAILEYGLLLKDKGDFKAAIQQLEKAK